MSAPRSTYRPPAGIPRRAQSRWQGWLVSLLVHAAIILALLIPGFEAILFTPAEGAGGPGPAGGGGGGVPGAGGGTRVERVVLPPYVPPAAPAKAMVSLPQAVVPPPPKTPAPPAPVPPTTPAPASTPQSVTPPVAAGTNGAGAGSGGVSGGAGAGPGSGGGVGSGEGSGRGSATGPGTGGGMAANYPPTPRQFFLPPLPAPKSVRGFKMTALFDVDTAGKATLIQFTPSPDGDYNKKLRAVLLAMKFRPGVRPDGTPVRDTVDVQFTF